MTSQTPTRYGVLDGWRGVACLLVLAYHCGLNFRHAPFALWGFIGVHMFFVLSGYLLFLPFAKSMREGRPLPNLMNFYARRFLRIYPPFLVSLTLFAVLRNATGNGRVSLWSYLEHASLLFNYDPSVNFFGINEVFWSLAIEVQYYALLPLGCYLVSRLIPGRAGVLATAGAFAIVGVLSRWIECQFISPLYHGNADGVRFRTVFSYLDLFAFGMAAAWLEGRPTWCREGRPAGRHTRPALIALGVSGFWLANQWCAWLGQGKWQTCGSVFLAVSFPVVLCGSLAILLLVAVRPPGLRPLRSAVLRGVGVISYSLYLYHAGIQFATYKLNPFIKSSYDAVAVGNFLVCIVPCVVASAVAYWAIERPSLGLVERVRRAAVRKRDRDDVALGLEGNREPPAAARGPFRRPPSRGVPTGLVAMIAKSFGRRELCCRSAVDGSEDATSARSGRLDGDAGRDHFYRGQ